MNIRFAYKHSLWQLTTENILDVCNHFSVVEIILHLVLRGAYFYFYLMLLHTHQASPRFPHTLGQRLISCYFHLCVTSLIIIINN